MYRLNNVDNLFDLFFQTGEEVTKPKALKPAMNAQADDKKITLCFEMPGFSKDEINISIQDRQLTIRAEHPQVKKDGVDWLRREISTGVCERVLTIPEDINAKGIQADCKNGLLTVTLPKVPKEDKVLKVAIS